MVGPIRNGQDVCAFCKKLEYPPLEKLRSTELLEMMQRCNPAYDRRSLFCQYCRERAIAKRVREKANDQLSQSKTSSRSDEKTGSYLNPSFLSLSSSSQETGPSRNVGRRTGGRPRNRSTVDDAASSKSKSTSLSPMRVSEPSIHSDTDMSNRASGHDATHRQSINHSQRSSQRSSTSNAAAHAIDFAEIEEEDEDANDDANASRRTSVSMQIAPLPRNRDARTDQPTRPPTPERMSSMSSQERSQEMRTYKRGMGG